MSAMAVCSNNGAAVLGSNGNYCQISAWQPASANQTAGQAFPAQLLTNISYTLVNSTATGTLTFQSLGGDGVWRAMATPAPISLSSATVNGTISGVYHGVRVALSGLAVSTVTYFELCGTVIGGG